MAVLQMGAVAMPLSQLFGPDALEYRLQDSAAVAAIVDASTAQGLASVAPHCSSLRNVVCVSDSPREGAHLAPGFVDWATALKEASTQFDLVHTQADDPVVLIYTSGTTGKVQRRVLRLQEQARAASAV